MSPYICQNFQLLIPYNFQFHHMVWKRFPTALNSYSILMRKRGKSRKSNFWNEKFFWMSSYTCEDFQDDIPDILTHAQKLHFHFGRKKSMFELTLFQRLFFFRSALGAEASNKKIAEDQKSFSGRLRHPIPQSVFLKSTWSMHTYKLSFSECHYFGLARVS